MMKPWQEKDFYVFIALGFAMFTLSWLLFPPAAKADWWNSTFTLRYKIIENKTTVQDISVNDTFGVNGTIIWALTQGNSYLYTRPEPNGINISAVATETTQDCWENETASMKAPKGNCIHELWDTTGNTTAIWHMNQTYANDSMLVNNCTVGEGIVRLNDTNKKFGSGVSFNGNSYLNCTTNAGLLNLVRDFTITAWVKTACNAAACGYGMISTMPSGDLTGGWQIYASNTQWIFNAYPAATATYNEVRETDRWYFIVANNNGTHNRLFVNGTERATVAMATVGPAYTSFNIGRNARDNQNFTGTIDEVRVYNETKSDAWIWNEWLSGTNNMTRLNASETDTFSINPRITPCREGLATEAFILRTKNETSDFTKINATMNMKFDVNNGTHTYTYNYSIVNETYSLCISPATLNGTTDAQIDFYNGSYPIRSYYLVGATIDNITDVIDLHLLHTNLASRITFTVKDSSGVILPNVYINVQRYYTEINSYKTAAMMKTDSNGQSNAYMEAYSVYYKFIIMDSDGTVLHVVPSMLITSSDMSLSIPAGVVPEFFSYYGTVAHNCTYTSSIRTIKCTVIETTGLMKEACLDVTYKGGVNDTKMAHNCSTSSSYTLGYIAPLTVNGTYLYRLSANVSSTVGFVTLEQDFFNAAAAASQFGMFGIWIFLFLAVTITFGGLAMHPLFGVVGLLSSMGLSIAFGLIEPMWSAFITAALLGVIIIYRMQRG